MRVLVVLIVLVFPVAEIWGLIAFSRAFGPWFAIYLVIAAIIGIAIIRHERVRMGPRLKAMLAGGAGPLPALLYTFRKLTAGILFVIPGVFSDLAAIILLLLPSRAESVAPEAAVNSAQTGPKVVEGEFHRIEPEEEYKEGELP